MVQSGTRKGGELPKELPTIPGPARQQTRAGLRGAPMTVIVVMAAAGAGGLDPSGGGGGIGGGGDGGGVVE
jgi:hypothetical protein